MLHILQEYFNEPTRLKFLIAILIFYVLDFATGFSSAWSRKDIQSSKMRHGVDKGVKYASYIVIGVVADFLFNIKVGCILMCTGLCCIELRSLIENFKSINLNVPDFILKLFEDGGEFYDDDL
jgi:toxin secretion/phage lysis holin